ncbi:hypothetical protein L1987_17342 [Smallanthus sonchifolius]|uniref:Uncharacterized protein n=1 Tax=Smallanthus sonchifolius TaxID=185202 RepID=A0ACB9IXN7_9ASTR|nr:hypothetical protein L1987_17342 [Smallanthus sonchifolius]
MEERRCAVVTGGNKGIGFEICRQLALNGIEVVLTARNESRGLEAIEKLNAFGIPNVVFHQLDIKNSTSIANLSKFIETRFKKLDILVNNAAENGVVYVDDKRFKDGGGFGTQFGAIQAGLGCFTNVRDIVKAINRLLMSCTVGFVKCTEALVPLLQFSKTPRIVNVSSVYGDLHWFRNDELKQELLDIENLTEERIDEIIQWFLKDFKAAKLHENGWPLTPSAYKVSKAALNAYTRLMARKFQNILVNAVHPGCVLIDMTSNTGIVTAEEGAKAPVMAALLPDDGPSGAYFNKMEIAPFMTT